MVRSHTTCCIVAISQLRCVTRRRIATRRIAKRRVGRCPAMSHTAALQRSITLCTAGAALRQGQGQLDGSHICFPHTRFSFG